MTLLAFVLTTLTWAADGTLQTVEVDNFTSMERCQKAGIEFEVDAQSAHDDDPPAFQGSWHWDCRMILNDSEKRHT